MGSQSAAVRLSDWRPHRSTGSRGMTECMPRGLAEQCQLRVLNILTIDITDKTRIMGGGSSRWTVLLTEAPLGGAFRYPS